MLKKYRWSQTQGVTDSLVNTALLDMPSGSKRLLLTRKWRYKKFEWHWTASRLLLKAYHCLNLKQTRNVFLLIKVLLNLWHWIFLLCTDFTIHQTIII